MRPEKSLQVMGFLFAPIVCAVCLILFIDFHNVFISKTGTQVFHKEFFSILIFTIIISEAICFIPGLIMVGLLNYFNITSIHKCYVIGPIVGVIYRFIATNPPTTWLRDNSSSINSPLDFGAVPFGATMGFVWALAYGLIVFRK